MATKRKTTTAIVAGATALALLLGGTFAWTSISQTAKNETAGIVNVGGRLHDDFDGNNKDVYVENFTDPLNGGQPIYARVRLDEYMEVGKDAGGIDVDKDGTIDAVPVINGTKRDDVTTWKPHVPQDSCETCNSGDTCLIHDHWTWLMGGVEGDGSTIFMPTFNKDKDSLAADINGTYAGTNADDKIYYDDYVEYTTDNTAGGNNIAEADKEAYDGKIYSIIGTEIYDNDTDTEDNGGTREVTDVTHTAKQTSTATVMTMQAWLDAGSQPGNYWVYDTDGWAYWANPIMPGEATGLLLDGINMTSNPGEKCYYAINVVAQFATVGDWEYFDGTEENGVFDGTNEAKTLLETVSKNVATVTVTNVSGATLLEPGESYEFSANVTVNGQQVLAASDFEWSVLNADKTVAESTIEIDADGKAMLKIAEKETSKNLIVVAKATNSAYLGALGMCSVAVDAVELVVLVEADGMTEVEKGKTYTLYVLGESVAAENLSFTIDSTVSTVSATATMYEGDLYPRTTLTVGTDETAQTLTVTVFDSVQNASNQLTLTVVDTQVIQTVFAYQYGDDGTQTGAYEMIFYTAPSGLTTAEAAEYAGVEESDVFQVFQLGDTSETQGSAWGMYGNTWDNIQKVAAVRFANAVRPTCMDMYFCNIGLQLSTPTTFDWTNLYTSRTESMVSVFYYANVSDLDLSSWRTDVVKDMAYMFSNCTATSITFGSGWNTPMLTNMYDMFRYMENLTELDLSFFNTSSVTNMEGVFFSNYLTTLKLGDGWDTSNVTNMSYMFSGCKNLTLDCSGWNVEKITDYNGHRDFNNGCLNVTPPSFSY